MRPMQNDFITNYHGLALFSGGLDSILAVRVLMEQGLKIKCVHFVTPFFGDEAKVPFWRREYGLDIDAVDISAPYTAMLRSKPAHGVGSVLNPCVDCKILMMQKAVSLLPVYGASFLASGEVLGQRPMSQRRDTLNIIRRDAGVRELLLRPLCAKHLEPTPMEESGLVDREKLYDFSGRGRKGQMELAARFGITKIPTPAGGCLLTERENARSFWPVLQHSPAEAGDFRLALTGRQLWSFQGGKPFWLCVGRDKRDNEALQGITGENDLTFKVRDFPGPLAVARQLQPWPDELIKDAAAFMASFSGKAAASGGHVSVRVHRGVKGLDGPGFEVEVAPSRSTPAGWAEYQWENAKSEIKENMGR